VHTQIKPIPAASVPFAADVARRLVVARRLPVELAAYERSGGRPAEWSASAAGRRWGQQLLAIKRRDSTSDRAFFDATTTWARGINVIRPARHPVEPLLRRLSSTLALALEEAERDYLQGNLPGEGYGDAVGRVTEAVRGQLNVRFVTGRARQRDRRRPSTVEAGRVAVPDLATERGPIVPGDLWLDEDWQTTAMLHMRIRDNGAGRWGREASDVLDAIAERNPVGPTARLARLVAQEVHGEPGSVERAEAMMASAPVGMTEVMRSQHLDSVLG